MNQSWLFWPLSTRLVILFSNSKIWFTLQLHFLSVNLYATRTPFCKPPSWNSILRKAIDRSLDWNITLESLVSRGRLYVLFSYLRMSWMFRCTWRDRIGLTPTIYVQSFPYLHLHWRQNTKCDQREIKGGIKYAVLTK